MNNIKSRFFNHTAYWHAALLVTVTVLPLAIPAAHAGQYVLEKGKGVEVCEAYGKNLNSFKPDYTSMICERQVNPDTKDFSKPKWNALSEDDDVAVRLDRYELTRKFMGWDKTGEYVTTADSIRAKARQGYDQGRPIVMEHAVVDIDNDGKPEQVLKERQGSCLAQRAYSVSIAILTEDGKHLDLEKSKYINPDLSKIAAKLTKDASPQSLRTAGVRRDEVQGYLLYDVFLYKGKSYFDLWEMGKGFPDPRVARLHVFSWQSGKTHKLCTYRFSETN